MKQLVLRSAGRFVGHRSHHVTSCHIFNTSLSFFVTQAMGASELSNAFLFTLPAGTKGFERELVLKRNP